MYKTLFTRSVINAKTFLAPSTQTRGLASINKVILLGNVGADPQEVTFNSGKKITTFPLATSRRYKDSEGNIVEQTYWHKIRIGGQSAETVMNIVKKGCLLQVEGSLRYDTYNNKDNIDVHSTSIVADKFQVHAFPKRKDANEQSAAEEED
ncbi:hypothetical protein LPJ57_003013 [Coemansia sp. RSA 486]|nr:hypothetical protein LPJ57_003013 [Coemansia sp. RSA 486]